MKNLLLLVLGCLPVFAWGQFGPQIALSECNVCGPRGIHGADLNGDEHTDFISISYEDNRLVWYPNDGQGNFDQQHTIAEVENLSVVTSADFDNDGDQDIIFGALRKIGWVQNDGEGIFSEPQVIADSIESPIDILVTDFNNDNILDLLYSARKEISWFKNEGNGIFSKSLIRTIERDLPLPNIAFADFNRDGYMDILVSEYDDLFWYENNGQDSFSENIILQNIGRISDFTIKDIDNDGDNDLLVNKSEFQIYLNDGNNDYQLSNTNILDSPLNNFHIFDFNNDNRLDILIDFKNNSRQLFIATETVGTYEAILILESLSAEGKNFIADLNGDDYLDIASSSIEQDKLSTFMNNGTGNFHTENIIACTENDYPSSMTYVDIDQDGYQDILFSTLIGDKVAWYKNKQGIGFDSLRVIANNVNGCNFVTYLDMDNDGDQDVIASATYDNKIVWYENDGNGNFSTENIVSNNANSVKQLDKADLDNDGDLDILAIVRFNNKFVWYKNNDSGTSFEEQIIRPIEMKAIYATDLDEDGDDDIIAASGSQVSLYINYGNENIIPRSLQPLHNNAQPYNFRTVDLDNDSDLDIVYITNYQIGWYRNEGNSSFSSPMIIVLNIIGGRMLDLNDIDNDGDLDIISTNHGLDGNLVWYENDGEQNYTLAKVISEETIGLQAVYSVDIDNDGDEDLISASSNDDKIAWYENLLDTPAFVGTAFFDENGNKEIDTDEITLNNISINVQPNSIYSFTDNNGDFRFYLSEGIYNVSVDFDECWKLTTDSLSYTINTVERPDRLLFGFQLASDYQHTQARINSAPTRCGFEVPFTLSVENDGCVPSQGQYGIVLDELVTLISTAIEPDEVRGDTLLWNYEELIASQNDRVQLTLEIAGADFIGDTIRLTGVSYIENEQGALELSSTYDYTSEIRCAYDPNDKLVYPNRAGEYDANYTLFEEQLEYTVRFQNTGNDTAFTVIIRDYLDTDLDWTSFKPVLASHQHETLLHADGLVEFTFRDILLPDSTTNEPLSHGFVTYRISPKADLEENTEIENTANIFFDFNPPIETNTTTNVLVSELPKMTSTKEINTLPKIAVYPNPFEEEITFQMEQRGNYQLQLFDVTGRLVQAEKIEGRIETISTENLVDGLYFYQIKDRSNELLANGKLVKSSR